MIANNKRIAPRLTFGLGRTSIEVIEKTEVTVWQKVLFNKDVYKIFINGIEQPNLNKFTFVADDAGEFSIVGNLVNTSTGETFNLDPIFINVIKPTFDATTKAFDSTLYTFDNAND
jgi:hypothetical protein